MRVFLDIETIGTEDPDVIAEITAGIMPPGNISKAETIAAWETEKKPALVAEAVKRTSFDGGLGRVICVGIAFGTEPADAISGSEVGTLVSVDAMLSNDATATIVGHNVGWDVRFLWQRFVVNNIQPPAVIVKAAKAKPWDIEDTMTMWNPDRERKISLDRLCKVLGVPSSKGDMDGSKVWDAYRAGEIDKIADYCRRDVEAMRACWARMTFEKPGNLRRVA